MARALRCRTRLRALAASRPPEADRAGPDGLRHLARTGGGTIASSRWCYGGDPACTAVAVEGEEPVWLVRIVIILFFAAFAVFLAREIRAVVDALQ